MNHETDPLVIGESRSARWWRRKGAARQRLAISGMTAERVIELLEDQQGCCSICGFALLDEKTGKIRFHADHDHETGQARGLVCPKCNLGLGLFSDDPAILRRAADYVEEHQ